MAVACREARTEIDIATPFLSANVAAYLVRACDDGKARKRRLLTAMNTAAVEGGYLDPDGVEEFVAAGFEVRSLTNLHAKVLIADAKWALIGSGNLTTAGSNGGNAELGVVLDQVQARTAQKKHFNPWWAAAEPLDLAWMRRLKRKAPASPKRRRREGQGGTFKALAGVDLDGFSASKYDSGYWLKILYGTDERTLASHWRKRMWVSDRHTVRDDGKVMRKPSYKIGEHLVIYYQAATDKLVQRSCGSPKHRGLIRISSNVKGPLTTPRNGDGSRGWSLWRLSASTRLPLSTTSGSVPSRCGSTVTFA